MIRHQRLKHQFVEYIPERLAPGVLYISIEYATSAHSCCCGCGAEVVTPFTPTDWRMTFDGETISLSPSVGNWNIACRSHYFIDRGRVVEAAPWTAKQIASERMRDKHAKARFYRTREAPELSSPPAPIGMSQEALSKGLLRRLMSKLGWGD